jgi:hypothetical protein
MKAILQIQSNFSKREQLKKKKKKIQDLKEKTFKPF